MKLYAHHGISDFVVCLGYKGYMIKEYFANLILHNSDVTIDAKHNEITYHNSSAEPWRVTLVDTGEQSGTGGRLRRVAPYLANDEPFCMTYGDGLADVDLSALISHHYSSGLDATVTAVIPPGRYGALKLDGDLVERFTEKPPGDGNFINGGFFVLSPEVIARIPGDDTAFEAEPLEALARDKRLGAFRHRGFWQPMDTLRDRNHLQSLWESGHAPWKIWD
jgi:glucose-1-phosphate cytidylyltransferase